MCTAVRYGVLMQCCVRQPDNAIRQSDLIDKVINERDSMRMFCGDMRS